MRSPHPTDAAPMHLMSYRGFVGEVERDAERGLFVGTLTDIPDTVRFQGPRLVLLAAAMARTVDEYIARRQEWGLPCDRPFIDDRRVRLGAVRKPA